MSRHPFSRRAHRRIRKGPKATSGLWCVIPLATPGATAILKPRRQKQADERIVRLTLIRRGMWKPRDPNPPMTLRLAGKDPATLDMYFRIHRIIAEKQNNMKDSS